jgi:hypothetical protein
MAYVEKAGETDVPSGIQNTLSVSNNLQDIVVKTAKFGLTGNQITLQSIAETRKAGIDRSIYSHAISEHGHGAGTPIGLWDRQIGVPGRGDVPIILNTCYSIELQSSSKVPEWDDQVVSSAQEEDVVVDSDGSVDWILERQTKIYVT